MSLGGTSSSFTTSPSGRGGRHWRSTPWRWRSSVTTKNTITLTDRRSCRWAGPRPRSPPLHPAEAADTGVLHPEDGGSKLLPDYTVSHPKTNYSSCYKTIRRATQGCGQQMMWSKKPESIYNTLLVYTRFTPWRKASKIHNKTNIKQTEKKIINQFLHS
jgi:hypothetical protein